MGKLTSITLKPGRGRHEDQEGYKRISVIEARLVADYGIEGDGKGGREGRHLNVMAAETIGKLAADGLYTAPGALGEQIVIDGLAIDSLAAGTRLRIGAEAVIELVKLRTGCEIFERYQRVAADSVAGRIGMMAVVVTSGPIRIYDPVVVL